MIQKKKTGGENTPASAEPTAPFVSDEDGKWGLGFIGLLSYIFIQYTRLPIMYPSLAPLQLGKVALIAAMLGYLVERSPRPAQGNPMLKGGVIFLAIVTLMSALSANYRVLPSADLWNIPEQLIVFFLISRSIVNRWREKGFVFLLLLLSFKVAQHGLRYYFHMRGVVDDASIIKGGGIIGGGGGFLDNAADLGVGMCVVFGLSFALMQSNVGRRMRWFYGICLITFGALILLCGSRGAVLGAAGVLLITWFRSPQKKWAAPILLLFVLGLMYLLPDASKDRFESAKDWQNDATAHHRVLLWGAGIRMWKDYPILGVGPANYQYVRAAEYPIPVRGLDKFAFVCHSAYIQLLSELGTLGAIAFLIILFSYFRMNSHIRNRILLSGGSRQDWEYCLASGLDLAMVGLLVSGAFVSVFWYPHIWILSGLAAGLNSATASLGELPPDELQNLESRPISGLALARQTGAESFAAKSPEPRSS